MTTPKDTWISVKDAMPQEDDKYAVEVGISVWIDGWYDSKSGNFTTLGGDLIIGVTHWMLLSKPKNKYNGNT